MKAFYFTANGSWQKGLRPFDTGLTCRLRRKPVDIHWLIAKKEVSYKDFFCIGSERGVYSFIQEGDRNNRYGEGVVFASSIEEAKETLLNWSKTNYEVVRMNTKGMLF